MKDKQGDAERFLRFILEQDWYETSHTSQELKRCPVRLSKSLQGEVWSEAGKAYFAREWENGLLAGPLYRHKDCAWVADVETGGDKEKRHRAIEWLGVAHCPRIVEEYHQGNVWQLPEDCGKWKQYLETARDNCGRRVERVSSVSRMDHLALDGVDARIGSLLIRLIAQYWAAYYHDRAEVTAEGTQSRERYYRSWPVKAKWWWEVCERLPLPRRDGCAEHVALASLWLPDKRTERAIGDLLPVIDRDAFGNDKDAVCEWLISAVDLRTRIEQLTVEEWKGLLFTSIPRKAPAGNPLRPENGFETEGHGMVRCMPGDRGGAGKWLRRRPLCRARSCAGRGILWQYVANEPQYLNDDNDLATAFTQDVWLFHIPTRLANDAVKYLGVFSLSGVRAS